MLDQCGADLHQTHLLSDKTTRETDDAFPQSFAKFLHVEQLFPISRSFTSLQWIFTATLLQVRE